MRKIGGVNTSTISRKLTKENIPERYCSVYESLKESLKEVKLIREGKIKPKTWQEFLEELKEDEEE